MGPKPTPHNKELNETCAGCLKKDLAKAIQLARFLTKPLLPPTMSVGDKYEWFFEIYMTVMKTENN